MKKIIIVIGILVGILGMLIAYSAKSEHYPILKSMKLGAWIVNHAVKN